MFNLTSKLFGSFSSFYKNLNLSSSTGKSFLAKDMTKQLIVNPFPLPAFKPETLVFGNNHSDHMITIPHCEEKGWGAPSLTPFQKLSMHPFNTTLHYSIQCYEGLKAYKNERGEVRIFRPDCNAFRFKHSSMRITLPDFDGEQLVKCLEEYVKVETRWIPPISEYSLYLRPFHISMEDTLGVKNPTKTQIMIIASPVGPYYPSGFSPISLSCATESIRSADKGTGSYKIGGNYSPTILTAVQVAKKGYQQALWLLGDKILEVGSSNIFFVFKQANGQIEVATPDLEDLVLPGVTRDSILALLRDQKQYKVSERTITITEVMERQQKGELLECFGAGTAVIVSSVKNIQYNGKDFPIALDPKINAGPITFQVRKDLLDIQEGRKSDKFGWVRRVI